MEGIMDKLHDFPGVCQDVLVRLNSIINCRREAKVFVDTNPEKKGEESSSGKSTARLTEPIDDRKESHQAPIAVANQLHASNRALSTLREDGSDSTFMPQGHSPNRRLSSHAKREKRKSIALFLEHIGDEDFLPTTPSKGEEVDEVYNTNKAEAETGNFTVIVTVLKVKQKMLSMVKKRSFYLEK
jgi:hypothetical protein